MTKDKFRSRNKPIANSNNNPVSKSLTPTNINQPVVVPINPPSTGGGFFRTLSEGVFLGAGSTIGSRIVDSIIGPRKIELTHNDCEEPFKQYRQCVKDGNTDCDNLLPDKCKK